MIFKQLTQGDSFFVEMEQTIAPLFSSSVALKKTVSGWNTVKNASFTTDSTLTGSVYFVDNNKFYVAYATSSALEPQYNLAWNSMVSAITNEYDFSTEEYPLYFNGTKITEAVIISFNPENLNQGIDYDNFFVVLSGSANTSSFTDIGGNGRFDVTNNLVLAPFFIKQSADDFTSTSPLSVNDKFISMTPAYEMRSSTNESFLTYNTGTGEIDIDWTQTSTVPYGVIFPEVGLVLLFPELFGRAQITTAIRTNDKSRNTLNSIMYMGGYSEKKVDKQIFFARLGVNEFNRTLNETAYEVVDGALRIREEFESNPTTYVTRVGLYNNYNECLATGFFSQPEKKTSMDELPIRLEITM